MCVLDPIISLPVETPLFEVGKRFAVSIFAGPVLGILSDIPSN